MNSENTNWSQSVAGVCIYDSKVLLARHTYGGGKGRLIIPGGYMNFGETPQEALKREFKEETRIDVEPRELLGIRFNLKDWYAVFFVEFVSGDAESDGDENSEVVWLDVNEALGREDVPELTKEMLKAALNRERGFVNTPYSGGTPPYSLYTIGK